MKRITFLTMFTLLLGQYVPLEARPYMQGHKFSEANGFGFLERNWAFSGMEEELCYNPETTMPLPAFDPVCDINPGALGNTWTQVGADVDGEAAGDQSGFFVSVSADGNIMAVGSPFNNNKGSVRVYQNLGGNWAQLGADIDGVANGDGFGISTALSADGSILAVGANTNNVGGTNSGQVRVYQYDGSSWVQLGASLNGMASLDYFGRSVSLSADGNILAVGATGVTTPNGSDSGQLRMYSFNGTSWNQLGAPIHGEGADNWMGLTSVLSADGTIVAVGAHGNDGNGVDSGDARVFQYDGSSWNQLGATIYGETAGNFAGGRLALSADGSTLAVGAAAADTANGVDSGQVKLFSFNGSSWVQMGATIIGDAAGDGMGNSLSLSADGSILAVGVQANDGNGLNSGLTRVYTYDGSNWVAMGSDIYGEAADDRFGMAVALNSDGQTLVVGARLNDGNGADSGSVRVFNLSQQVTTCYNEAPTLSLPAASSSASGTIVYQWEVSTDNGATWSAAPGTNDQVTYTPDQGLTTTTLYRRGASISGCATIEYSNNVVVLINDELIIVTDTTNPSCGSYDGSIATTVSGGTAPYTYVWSNTATTANLIGLEEATYDLTVTDALGCTAMATVTLVADFSVQPGAAGEWTQLGADVDGEIAGDQSGYAVALSADGSIMAVAAPFNNNSNGNNSGSVRIYENMGGTWTQLGGDIDGDASDDNFGFSIALSDDGSIVAIGAYRNDVGGASAGQLKIFQYNGSSWTQMGTNIYSYVDWDHLGMSVALSADGNTVAVGVDLSDMNGLQSGHVEVYHFNGSSWQQVGGDIIGANAEDRSGYAISLSADGNVLAIGAPYSDASGADSGQVKIYSYTAGSWQNLGAAINGAQAGDLAGTSVSLSADGTMLAIGAPYSDALSTDGGMVRVYTYENSNWVQSGSDFTGANADDHLGMSVSLASDGNLVAVGAAGGYASVYEASTSGWQLLGSSVVAENTDDDFGFSVSLAENAYTLAVGAPLNDGNGADSGSVRVYELLQEVTTCYNEIPTFTFPNATTPSGTIMYQWEVSTDNGSTWTVATGTSDQASFTPTTGLTANGLYRRGVTLTGCGIMAYSNNVVVTVDYCGIMWTGAVSTDWETTGNWMSGVVPTVTDDVVVTAEPVNQPVITSGIEINTLTIADGALVTVDEGGTLIVTGTVSGNIKAQKPIDTNWNFMSCPVIGESLSDFASNHSLAPLTGSNLGFAAYYTPADSWSFLTPAILASQGATNLMPGNGASVLLSSPGVLNFTGMYNGADTSVALLTGGTGDFNLTGNPYVANMEVSTLLDANTASLNEKTIWFSDGIRYSAANLITGGIIHPLEGFMVSGTGNFNYTTGMMQSADAVITDPAENLTRVTLKLENASTYALTDIFLLDGVTTDIDNGYDSSIFTGQLFDLGVYTAAVSGTSTKKLAIQALPPSVLNQDMIPVGVREQLGGTVTFSLDAVQNLPTGQHVYLYDNVTGSNTELENGGTYQVTLPASTDAIGRFYLYISTTSLDTDEVLIDNIKVSGNNNTLTIMGLEDDASLSLYNMLGQEIYHSNLRAANSQQVQVNVAKGTYIVKVTNSLGTKAVKVVLGK